MKNRDPWESPDIRIEPLGGGATSAAPPVWSVMVDGREVRRFAGQDQAERFVNESIRAGRL